MPATQTAVYRDTLRAQSTMNVLEVFYAPGKLFASLPGRRGAWILPFVLNIVLVTVVSAVSIRYIGLENILRQQFEGSRIPPDQLEMIIGRAISAPQWRSYLNPILGIAFFQLIFAGALYAFALMANKGAKYKDQLALLAFAYLPYFLVVCLMTTLILISSPDPTSLNAQNLIATNAGAFMDKAATSKPMYSLASSMDILTIAELMFLAYGFSKVNRSKLALAVVAVFGIWILYLSVKIAISSIF